MEQHIINLVNTGLCIACIFVFICRINTMTGRREADGERVTRAWVQIEYAVGVGAMVASMFRPWWGEYPGYASLVVHFYILVHIVASAPAWQSRGHDEQPFVATKV